MNKSLKFRPELIPLIISGQKTITWRFFDDKNLQSDDIVDLLNSETKEKFGTARLTQVSEKPINKMLPDDYNGHEKFLSYQEFIDTYKGYYKRPITGETPIKVAHFELIK